MSLSQKLLSFYFNPSRIDLIALLGFCFFRVYIVSSFLFFSFICISSRMNKVGSFVRQSKRWNAMFFFSFRSFVPKFWVFFFKLSAKFFPLSSFIN